MNTRTNLLICANVRRILGTGGAVDYNAKSRPDFIIADGGAKVVVIEHLSPINGGIEITSDRSVVLRSLETRRITHRGKGPLFLEDVATDEFRQGKDQQVWARHLNIENEGTHITNDGGTLRVLGYKTEPEGCPILKSGLLPT